MMNPVKLWQAWTQPASADPTSPILREYRRFSPRLPLRIAFGVLLFVGFIAYGAVFAATFPYMLVPMAVPAVLLTAMVIWALPENDNPPLKPVTPLLLAFTGAMYLWPNYLAIALPGLPWLTLLRIIGTPLTLLILVSLSMSPAFRKQLGGVLAADPWVWRFMVIFLVLQVVSIAFSNQPGGSIARLFVDFTNWYVIFVVACYAFSRPGVANTWTLLVLGCAIFLCGIAIWEARLGKVPWADHIPGFLRIDDPAVQRTITGASRGGFGARRVAATTANPLNLAEFLAIIVPFVVHVALQKYPIILRVIAVLLLPLLAYVILLTDSRLGVGAGLLSIIIYLFFWAAMRWRRERNSIIAPALVLSYPVLFLLFLASTFIFGRLRAEVWGGGAQESSTQARVDQWNMGLPKLAGHPLGFGVGRSGDALGYANGAGILTIDTYYLMLLLEYGVMGFAIYMAMFGRAVWTAGRNSLSPNATGELSLLVPLSIALLNFMVIKSVMASEANHPLLFMMLGAAMALTARVKAADAQDPTLSGASSPRLRRTAGAVRPGRR